MDVERIEQNDCSTIRVRTDFRSRRGREALEQRPHSVGLARTTLADLEDYEVVAPIEVDRFAVALLGHPSGENDGFALPAADVHFTVHARLYVERFHNGGLRILPSLFH